MAANRGRDTRPELLLRRGLHARGRRYRLQDRALPGRPDLVFPGPHAVIFVHGCFWHGHDCPMFKQPASNGEFWRAKIDRNRERDATALSSLRAAGWRVLTVWECALRGRARCPLEELLDGVHVWLAGGQQQAELRGQWEPVV